MDKNDTKARKSAKVMSGGSRGLQEGESIDERPWYNESKVGCVVILGMVMKKNVF